MLNNFIYAQTKDLFLEQLEAGNILDEAIVFIEDTGEIWNHGTYFAGVSDSGLDEGVISEIQTAVADIQANKADKSTLDLYVLKSELSVPTKISDLTDDSDFATNTEVAATYTTKETTSDLQTQITNGLSAKLDKTTAENTYAKKTDIPSLSGYLTETTADGKYATISTVNELQEEIDGLTTTVNNKLDSTTASSTYATKTELTNGLAEKQATLVSGTNIKTVEGQSILGTGDIQITAANVGAYTTGEIDTKVTSLTNSINNAASQATSNKNAIDTLNGAETAAGSVKKTAKGYADSALADAKSYADEITTDLNNQATKHDNDITAINTKFNNYATTTALGELGDRVADIEDLIATDSDAVIDKWDEVVTFLDGIGADNDLEALLAAKANQTALDATNTTIANLKTSQVAESGNLYFTDARAQAAVTGGASTIASSNLTANRALISNASGKVAVSAVTSTELSYLDGVTDNIQTQLDSKADDSDITSINTTLSTLGSLAYKSSLVASDIPALDWSKITSGKPTTLAGYGITNAYTKVESDDRHFRILANITNNTNFNNLTGLGIHINTVGNGTGNSNYPTAYGYLLNFRTGNGSYYDGSQLYVGADNHMRFRGHWAYEWYAWRTVLDDSNYTDYTYSQSTIDTKLAGYLPLSGGKISGSATNPVVIDTSSTFEVGLRFTMSGSAKGWVGYTPNTGIYLYSYGVGSGVHMLGLSDTGAGFLDSYTLIHSGNIVDYAILKKEGIVVSDDYNVIGYGQTANGWPQAGPAMAWGSWQGYRAYLHGRNGVLRFNTMEAGTLTGWKQIAFTDSDITGNAATANVLKSTTGIQYTYNFNTDKIFVFGNGIEGYKAYIDGSLIALRYGSQNATGFILNSSGNVTIGSSDLAGTSAKLYVNGNTTINGVLDVNNSVEINNGSLTIVKGQIIRFHNTTDNTFIEALGFRGDSFHIGYGNRSLYDTYVQGNNIVFRPGAGTEAMRLDSSGAMTTASTILASSVICGTTRLRVNATGSTTVFGFIDALPFQTTTNVASVHIGSCYGGSSDITNTTEYSSGVSMTAISIYRGKVGIGKRWSDTELRALHDAGIYLGVAGSAKVDGALTVGGGATITGNSTINGNLVVTGDVASAW